MIIAKTKNEVRAALKAQTDIGFVPTMGALHAGHMSLVAAAKNQTSFCAVSIFVNPTQFNDASDFENYPNTLDDDIKKCETAGVDLLYIPSAAEMYPDGFKSEVRVGELDEILEGAHRPSHFNGVCTVVLKLLNQVRPQKIFMGEKDYQQLQIIKQMLSDLDLNVEVIGCATMREADGLAMSSRNQRLTDEQRKIAPKLYEILQGAAQTKTCDPQKILDAGFDAVDYFEERWGRIFVAAHLGSVRLIDNIQIRHSPA